MVVNTRQATAEDALDTDELRLYELVLSHRATVGLAPIPLSASLTAVAGRKVLDTLVNVGAFELGAPGEARAYGWSDAPYDGRNPATYGAMWEAPSRLGTGYPGYGFELAVGFSGADALSRRLTPDQAFATLIASPGQRALIEGAGSWGAVPWEAVGVGMRQGVAFVWLGREPDPAGTPAVVADDDAGLAPPAAPTLHVGPLVLSGSARDNLVRGGAGPDTLAGLGGADRLFGQSGNDTLDGGDGDDTLDGGTGDDRMAGGPGNDTYAVDSLGDVVVEAADGGSGDRAFVSVSGWQVPAGVEAAYLVGAADRLLGGEAPEQLVANPALASTLSGGGGADVLWGTALSDTLLGGPGDDTLRSQGGPDRLEGGPGDDTYTVFDWRATVIEQQGGGHDVVWVMWSGFTVPANVEVARLVADNAWMRGGAGRDVLSAHGSRLTLDGGSGDDELWGGPGTDRLIGGAGDDILRGQGGADTFEGGAGNDQFTVFDPAAVVVEAPGGGIDTAWVSAAGWTLSANVETARLAGEGARWLRGGAGPENLVANPLGAASIETNAARTGSTLDGGGGNDILWGSAFADTFTGGAGQDIIYSYGGADRFVFAPGGDWDQVSGFVPGSGMRLDVSAFGTTWESVRAGLSVDPRTGLAVVALGGADRIWVYDSPALGRNDFLF